MGALDSSIDKEIFELRQQLEKVRLTHRESSFKFNREQKVLKRLLTSLAGVCLSDNAHLNKQLMAIKKQLEQQKDISDLIPTLAILERALHQQTLNMDKQNKDLDYHIRHGGETLLRVPGLPSRVKRDLRDLLSFSDTPNNNQSDQALRLIGIYERSVKIIAANPDLSSNDMSVATSNDLLERLTAELQSLINELDFDSESGDLLLDIRNKLVAGVPPQGLLELTLEVLRLVVEGTKHERKSSEKFLDNVNNTLTTNIKNANQILSQSQSYHAHRNEMNNELGSLVNRSQKVLSEGSDTDTIKRGLTPLFSDMRALYERLEHAEKREKALIEQVEYAKSQMENLQETTSDYRRRLLDQTKRMQQDPLTKTLNRSAFHEQLELEYHRWIKSQHCVRVALFDIDNFRVINDKFGYTAGDKAIKIIARTIQKDLLETDILARFGGEEFIVIMPDRDDFAIRLMIESVQKHVQDLPFKFKSENLTITLSVATVCFKENDTPEELLERLNRTMIEGKKIGPNQLIWK